MTAVEPAHIAVVIPAFNEAETIADVVEKTCGQVGKVIVVDDASSDGTPRALYGLPVDFEHHAQNRGKAAALWTGIQRALKGGASAVITLDGDGQHNPADIVALLAAHEAYPDEIIIAARHWGREKAPVTRRMANRVADFWISWAAGIRIYDSQSGFRLYPISLLRKLSVPVHCGRDFVFESEALIEAAWLGFGCVAVPVCSIYLEGGRASHYKPLKDTVAIVKMVADRLFRKRMYPGGLIRSLFGRVRWAETEYSVTHPGCRLRNRRKR